MEKQQGGRLAMAGIVAENISKSYTNGKKETFAVLSNINLTVNEGEFVSIIGESGSGKSTLSRLVMGIEYQDSGSLIIDGNSWGDMNVKEKRMFRRNIQGVFQDSSGTLNPNISAYKNVEIALRNLTNFSKEERKKKILSLMEHFNMQPELLKTPVKRLSGGEQRRLSILRALSVKPKYLILDEILSGLDLISANAVMEILTSYQKEYHCGYLFITHDMQSAYRLSDKILLLESGRFIRQANKLT